MTLFGIGMLKRQEGLQLKVYKDQLGFPTIGYGHFCVKNEYTEITLEKAEELFREDIAIAEQSLRQVFYTSTLYRMSLNRFDALINMMFQLGFGHFLHFPKAIAHVKKEEWKEAADDFRDSIWAKVQTPERAKEVIDLLERG